LVPVLIGYFAKKTVVGPEWLKAAGIREVCSASNCISEAPSRWIDAWKHNAHWLYDTPELAASVIAEDEGAFEMYAFKQYPVRIDAGEISDESVSEPNVALLTGDFQFVGYDAVARSCGNAFECSPLSCNQAAESLSANSRCLFDTLEEAVEGAKEFSQGPWEPGPYYVVEVYRRKSGGPGEHEPSAPQGGTTGEHGAPKRSTS
jgi:hypothetical protein